MKVSQWFYALEKLFLNARSSIFKSPQQFPSRLWFNKLFFRRFDRLIRNLLRKNYRHHLLDGPGGNVERGKSLIAN